MKKCSNCKEDKPLSEFNKHSTHKDGLTSWCKTCLNKNPNRWTETHKEERLAYLKTRNANSLNFSNILKSKPCTDCGMKFHPCQMEWDHTENNKIDNPARLRSNKSLKNFVAEILKCDLVCANCHRLRTYQRQHPKEFKNVG